MSLDFNYDPYYDDFDPSKNYHRILFKPGVAVQARELTQSQTILQDQISKFADNIFKQNSPVTGGQVTTNLNCYYIKLNTSINNVTVDVSELTGLMISDALGTVNARIIATAPASGGDAPTLIVSYESGTQFGNNDYIYSNGVQVAQAIIANATGKSSVVSISQGVFYISGNYTNSLSGALIPTGTFVQVNPQTIIISKYSNVPSVRVGLTISESIITSNQDVSLQDPAAGASNYQAPGADRYQIKLTLTSLPLTLGNDSNFIELVRVVNGSPFLMVDGSVYNVIDDYMAKRTYETNGDYIVNDFSLTPVSNTSSINQYDINIGKGTAYVHGYRLENKSNLVLTNDRARTTVTQNNNPVYISYGQFFYVDSVNGVFDIATSANVDLHCVPVSNISPANATTYNSSLVGKAFIRNLAYDHADGVDSNTTSYVYRAYVYDFTANNLSGNATSATSTTISPFDINGKFSATANAYINATITIDSGPSAGDIRNIINYQTSGSKVITVDTPFSTTPTSASQFTIRFATQDVEAVVVSNSTFGIVSSAGINNLGKMNGVSTGDTIYQNVTNYPEMIFSLGNAFVSNVFSSNYSTTKVFRGRSFSGGSLAINLSADSLNGIASFGGGTGTLSSSAIKQNFTVIATGTTSSAKAGQILDFTSSGNTVSISNSTVTFTSGTYGSTPVVVIANIQVSNSDDSKFTKIKQLVTGTTSSMSASLTSVDATRYIDLTAGQLLIYPAGVVGVGQSQSLLTSDVKRISKIIDTKITNTAFLTTANVTPLLSNPAYDISSNYSFNNGQKDSMYDHAYITLNPGAPVPTGAVLVIYDFYKHTGGDGFFTVGSYVNESYSQIPTFTSRHGTNYNLRDCIDFRPTRVNGQIALGFDYNNTSTPSDVGMYTPIDGTYFYSNYTYYLGRKDKLVLSKDKTFQIVKGSPSVNPIYPTEPDGSLVIATFAHDPYTSYLPSEAPAGVLPNLSVQKVQHRRWTMSDISNLQTQVNNIEYYTTLNLLEQNAQNLQVPDAYGLNRFKNGILVDDFSSYGTADTANPDFSASIDRVAKKLSATQSVTNYPLQSSYVLGSVLGSSVQQPTTYAINNIGKTTNYFSLPYTTANVIVQQYASNTVNLNPFTSPIYSGVMDLNPPMDNWVDNTKQPDLLIVDPNLQVYQSSNTLNTLNITNWQTIPGTQYTVTGPKTNVIGHNINASPYGYVGYSTQTTNTFASATQQTTTGYWTNLGSSYTNTNGFITDVSIQPYIRPQQVIFRARGLKTNTPVGVYFDGVPVNNYISAPDVIELNNVSGTFQEDDVLGYYTSGNQFVPIATVVSVYSYPNTNGSRVRLYITSHYHSSFATLSAVDVSTSVLCNGKFNNSGVYLGNTAFGTANSLTNIITMHSSGYISSVGGNFTDASGASKVLYRAVVPGYSSFMNAFGVWGDQKLSQAGNLSMNLNFTVTNSGTYYFQAGADDAGTFSCNGVSKSFASEGTACTWSQFLSTGTYQIQITSDATAESFGDAQYALAASTGPWTAGTPKTTGTVVFSTTHPSTTAPDGGGTITQMAGGGAYYTGVTKVALNASANTVTDWYKGATISFVTTYITQPIVGGPVQQTTQNYSAKITAYDGLSRIATLDTPVNISVGVNTLVGGMITSTYSLNGIIKNYLISSNTGGAPIFSTNENGVFAGVFNIPQSTFRTGDRVLRVDNRTVVTDPSSSSTWCEATFTASGLSTKSQSIDFSPSISSASYTFTSTAQKNNVLVNSATVTNPWDPVAQTFIVDKGNFPNGVFISSLNVYFQSKANTTGSPVTLSIVGTTNGYPNGQTLNNSIVTLTPDKINTSSKPKYFDSSAATTFTFDAPVYIQPGVLYAFILRSASSDYNIFIAEQNATAIPESTMNLGDTVVPSVVTKIATAPYVGSLFESQNAITWVAQPTKSLMFVMNRCVFDTTQTPSIPFILPKGLPTRRLTTQDIQSYNLSGFDTSLVNNLNGIFSNSNVVSDAFNITTTDFVPTNTGITYTYQPYMSSGAIDNAKTVIPGRFGSPTYDNIYLDDGLKERALIASANSAFNFNAVLSSSDNTVSPFISDDGTSLYNIQWNINNLQLSNSVISLVSGGGNYSNSNVAVSISAPDVSGGVQAAAGVTLTPQGNVSSVYITTPGSGYLKTPTIIVSGSNTTQANVSVVSEFSPKGGNATTRYVTKKVTLTPGNDSGDLRVYFTAYRPVNSNIYVFYRIQNVNDNQTFENSPWQLMTYVNGTGAGYSTNRNDTMEFQVAPGINNNANNQVSYVSTNGNVFTSFNQFAIKIVMTTNDTTIVPYITDIRALALPQGTGL